MKRTIGFLMMVGLMVGIVGCGDDNNPVKSNQDLLAGTWLDDGDTWTFKSDGTYTDVVDGITLEGTWNLVGDQLTITYPTEYIRNLMRTYLADDAEVPVEDVPEEAVDEIMKENYPDANDRVVLKYTMISVTSTELTVTDEDGGRSVLTRKN